MKQVLRHIALLVMMVVLFSCQIGDEPKTRSSQLQLSSGYAAGVAGDTYEVYRGVVASREVGGDWISAPFSESATSWACLFVNGAGNVESQNNYLYDAGSYNFYLLGSNGASVVPEADGRLVVSGGEVSDNDYIWSALSEVEMDGVNDVTRSIVFSHLFSQVRFELIVRGVEGITEEMADVEILDISALGYRTEGVIDFENITTPVMQPSPQSAVLQTANLGERYMVVPHSGTYTYQDCQIAVRYDGLTYNVALSGNLSLNAGKCRVIRLVYDGFSIHQLEIPQWNIGEDFSIGNGASGDYEIPGWNH